MSGRWWRPEITVRDGVLHLKAENHWIFLTRRFIDFLMFHKVQIYSFPYPNQLFLCLSVTTTCIYKLQHVEYEETFLLAVELDV